MSRLPPDLLMSIEQFAYLFFESVDGTARVLLLQINLDKENATN